MPPFDLNTLLYALPILPTAVITYWITRRRERTKMNSDDFVARAIAQAEALNNQAHTPSRGDGRDGGIYVVGSHITIIHNVQHSEVLSPDSAAGSTRGREPQQA